MKTIKYTLIMLLLVLSSKNSYTQYWERITNLPAAYAGVYWLDVEVAIGNSNYVWACGFGGSTLRSTDNGTTWFGSTAPGADHLEKIIFPSYSTGYTSGVEGIWKSTDGGASWTNVTPTIDPNGFNYWGCYFVDDNNGVLVGEGCGVSQHFYKTTDGAATWTEFVGNEPNSGLTHALLYSATGEGYAESSGKIWKTTDGGSTWSIFATTGTNIWHEQLTKINNSFLVPYAGDNCQGSGANGGMRFSTDNGTSWNDNNVGAQLFGAFLTSETTGWAAGYNGNLWYTSNSGGTWTLKNCGIENRSLDNLYFTDPNHGWVVGDGVWRLSPAKQTISKTAMDFGESCMKTPRLDTLFLRSYNFNSIDVKYAINGPNAPDFSVIQPTPANFTMNSCDSLMFIVRYMPSIIGISQATLKIMVTGFGEFDVTLTGTTINPIAAIPKDTLILVNPLQCGLSTDKSIRWTSVNSNQWIMNMVKTGSPNINLSSNLPMNVTTAGADTKFTIILNDTGWVSARFDFKLFPCNSDTFITVKAYGTSPIINAQNKYDFSLECVAGKDFEIPVFNTGNDDLKIASIQFLNLNMGFSALQWKSNSSYPVIIKPKAADTLVVRFLPPKAGTYTTKLRFVNNDMTTIRGIKNPYDIDLNATIIYSKIVSKDTIIDFGEICINDSASQIIKIWNEGNLQGNIDPSKVSKAPFFLQTVQKIYPIPVKSGDTLSATVLFTPKIIGKFIDSLFIISSPCNELIKVYVKGVGIKANAFINPTLVSGNFKVNKPDVKIVSITNTGTTPVTITGYNITPNNPQWTVNITPPLPLVLQPGDSKNLNIEFTSLIDTILTGQIIFITESKCPVYLALNLNLQSSIENVVVGPSSLDFGTQWCIFTEMHKKITVLNDGSDTILVMSTDIIPASTPFIISPLVTNTSMIILKPGDSTIFDVQFNPVTPGSYNGVAEIVLNDKIEKYEIPLQGIFNKPIINPTNKKIDFGELEYCQDSTIRITFSNTGNIDDTLIIKPQNNTVGYSISQANQIIVKQGMTEFCDVKFDAKLVNTIGIYNESYLLTSSVCNDKFKIQCTAKIINPNLFVSPQELDYNNIWIGDSVIQNIMLYNNSGYNIVLSDTRILQQSGQYSSVIATPDILKSGDSLKIDVKFISKSPGTRTDSLMIIYESKCLDTLFVLLKSIVPPEEYKVDISIAKYVRLPGDSLTIAVRLDNPVYKFQPDSVDFSITFDQWLFYPRLMYIYENDNQVNLPFNYTASVISGKISKKYADTLFKSAGNKIWIFGVVLLSTPNETPLKIDKFNIYTSGNFVVNKTDGDLIAAPVCPTIGELRIRIIPTLLMKMKNQIVSDGEIILDYETSDELTLNITVNDLLGRLLISKEFQIEKSGSIINIPVSELPNGTYNIQVISNGGHFFRDKFINMK